MKSERAGEALALELQVLVVQVMRATDGWTLSRGRCFYAVEL